MAYHVAKGLGKAGHALMNDAIMDMPAVPLDEGTLRGSGSVFVGSDLVAVAQNVGGNPTPATELGRYLGSRHHQGYGHVQHPIRRAPSRTP